MGGIYTGDDMLDERPDDLADQERVLLFMTGQLGLRLARLLRYAAVCIEESRVAISEDSVWIDDFLRDLENHAGGLSRIALNAYLDAGVTPPSDES